MRVDIRELGLAYRRVKADMYYTKYANSIKLVRFERNLAANLEKLQSLLTEERTAELCSSYCHGWRLIPKAVTLVDEDKKYPQTAQTTILVGDELRRVSRCDLRIIEDVPVEFHVLAQLWIDRLGGRLEKAMSSHSFGNRIRCYGVDVNVYYPGTFKFWMRQYRDWHDNGLKTIRRELDAGKNIAVLTTDFTAFYHNLAPDFLNSAVFRREMGLFGFSKEDEALTSIIVKMLKTWAKGTPLGTGLPVGCSISSVIANLALTLLDRKLGSLKGVVYYGRYVDDIILAIENTNGIKDQEDYLKWLCAEVSDLVKGDGAIVYGPRWLKLDEKCRLAFQEGKTKVFLFNGRDGRDFVVGLENQIHKRTSEWRALPELPNDPEDLIKSIIAITDSHGVEVDKLRQAEEASIRRAAFAMKLSDFNDYALCLDASDWSQQRNAFVKAVSIYFTTVRNYFELSRYFPRLFGLALHGMPASDSASFAIIEEMLKRVARSLDKAFEGNVCISSRNADELDVGSDVKQVLTHQVVREFAEAITISVQQVAMREKAIGLIKKTFPSSSGVVEELPPYDEMLLSDLAQQPYKALLFSALDVVLPDSDYEARPIFKLPEVVPSELYDNAVDFLTMRREWRGICEKQALAGFIFPTRKMSRIELLAIAPDVYCTNPRNRKILAGYLRGISYADFTDDNIVPLKKGRSSLVEVSDRMNNPNRRSPADGTRIALAYWRMSDSDWEYQVNGERNPANPDRFSRLMRLTNDMVKAGLEKDGRRPDYILYPELAMPWRWFLLAEKKVRQYRISLISGVEYTRSTRKQMLLNEVWCGLTHSGNGFPDSLLIKVQKTCPANDERSELKAHNWVLDQLTPFGGFRAGDVIKHETKDSTLFFSVLICSDLTDIDLRRRLRGKIDLLCVPAWNRDVKTFNALVTSAAYDLHSYVAMCNNGQYGDTRIRGPFARDYERDIVQLKGGDNDYWVVGSVNSESLRRFHKECPAPSDPKFKPVPIGFKMSQMRGDCVIRIVMYNAIKSFRFVKVVDSVILVSIQPTAGEPKRKDFKFDLSTFGEDGEVLKAVGELVSKGVPSDVIKEFLLACKICAGVDVGNWAKMPMVTTMT